MRRFFGRIENEFGAIEGEDLKHLKDVLRLSAGDEVIVFNGDGFDYHCLIERLGKEGAQVKVLSKRPCQGLPKKDISLFLSLIRREKLELVLQKAVELGIKKVTLFESEFSSVKLAAEKISRYEKIVISASKQCERSDLLRVELKTFDQALSEFGRAECRLFANERQGENFDFLHLANESKIALLVGCEGGFSPSEKAKILKTNPHNVSLGDRILRAETAAIVLSGIASLMAEN